jgi:hypothetical protein
MMALHGLQPTETSLDSSLSLCQHLSDSRVFINRRPGLRLGSVLVELKEDAKLLTLTI